MENDLLQLISFGPEGWGRSLALAALMTLAVAITGFAIGVMIGILLAWGRIAGNPGIRMGCEAYTTVMRGIPDLLVIYLFYFGGSLAVTNLFQSFGREGFTGIPPFLAGAAAIGCISGAYQSEVYRGAFRALSPGEIDAGRSVGMHRWLLFRRIIAPQVARHALPAIGNIWQMALKESALISITGLVELMRQSQIAAGSTRRPFEFYLIAAGIYLTITWVTQIGFEAMERRSRRSITRNVP